MTTPPDKDAREKLAEAPRRVDETTPAPGHRRPHRALREGIPLRSYLLNAAAIGIAVLLAPALTNSSATVAVPRPPEVSTVSSEPVPDPRFAADDQPAPPGAPDRNATRDALDHDDTLAPPPPGKAAASNGSDFVSPVPGPITGGFGQRFHPILHYWRMHNGVDMRAACGTVVIASYRGKVVQAGPNGGYGNLVVIDHGTFQGKHVISKYAHLSRIGVRVGDQVETAQGIALSGTTGLSTGCHLHFEIKENGSYVDPAPYLTGKSSPRPDGPIKDLGPSASSSPRPSSSPTPSSSPSARPSASPKPSASATPSRVPSPSPSESVPTTKPSPTPSESEQPTPAPSESEKPTPAPSESAKPTPAPSEKGKPSPSPTQSKEPKPEPSESTKPQPKPTVSAKPQPSPTPTTKDTPVPTPTRSKDTPEPTPTKPEEGSAEPSPSATAA